MIQEVLPVSMNQPPASSDGDAWGAGIRLAARLLDWLGDVGLKLRVDDELAALQPQINAAMPRAGGVLVVVGIQESDPDPTGRRLRSFIDAYVAATGQTPGEAFEVFRSADRLDQGTPPGFIRRDSLMWITKAG
ncbi:MAG: hypothetical protein WCQ64_03515 [Acidobacteriota bacterium]